ncbi:MAG: S8 family peptidase, partial [Bacteroidia bacterium]
AEYADSVGVDIITTSLGYTEFDNPQQNHNYASLNGKTAPMSIAATMAARKGILVINAAGNEGNGPWKYISVPADADSILAVGAVDTTGRVASFSGYGPTADGRIKPDVSACGWGTWICDGASNCFYGNGTSFAAPLLAGAAACYWQQHKTLSNIEILNRIKSKSSFAQKPNNRIGWGVPNLCMPLTDLDFTLAWIKELKGVRIRLSETYYSELHLKIYNTQGQLVYVSALPISQWVHDMVLPLASGVYIFEIQSNRGVRTKKVIIP